LLLWRFPLDDAKQKTIYNVTLQLAISRSLRRIAEPARGASENGAGNWVSFWRNRANARCVAMARAFLVEQESSHVHQH
jgi:hypothetical protein